MKLLLCTDMDRTVIPNGMQAEASDARANFRQFCARPEVTLAYVTGRHLQLMQAAVSEYHLPQANYAITDVGTRIYQRLNNQWQSLSEWEAEIDQDWQGIELQQVIDLVCAIAGISLQESEKQNPHKISFYVDLASLDETACLQQVAQKLEPLMININLIWSIDETTETGLLDILPPKANKLHAISFLQKWLDYSAKEVIFAGDSGNDLQVLISPVQSVLVANATENLKQQTLELAKQEGTVAQFYQANNEGADDFSGNYSAGVLQGVSHFLPAFKHCEINQD